ncbi:glycosyltransferase family 4 protein [Angustibacter aerolatus]
MTRRPRVLQVAPRFPPDAGGTETHVAEVTRRLQQQGEFDVTVLTTDRAGDRPRSEVVDGVPVLRRRAYPRAADVHLAPGIAPVIARGGWDLVHLQSVHTLVPPLGMATALASRRPYVLTFHSGGHSSAGRNAVRDAQWKTIAPLLRRADRLIAVSRFERDRFAAAAGIDPSRFAVIGNGGVLPPTPEGVVPVPGRIVSSGRLEEYKGHQRIIAALPRIRQRVPEAHLVVLGTGPYEAPLRALAHELGVADVVDIRSVPPGDRLAMARELASASIMASLSSYEAHPVGIMEAVTLGLPVVGLDVAGTGDLVEDGLVTGIPGDATPDQVADALADALVATGARGAVPHVPVAVELPTWETSTEQLAQVYREVLAARAAGRRP